MAGAECPNCRWVISPKFSFCPWCAHDLEDEGPPGDGSDSDMLLIDFR